MILTLDLDNDEIFDFMEIPDENLRDDDDDNFFDDYYFDMEEEFYSTFLLGRRKKKNQRVRKLFRKKRISARKYHKLELSDLDELLAEGCVDIFLLLRS